MADETPKVAEEVAPVEEVPLKKKSNITDAEKEAFFKCFLAEQNYSEKIGLFDNKIPIVIRTLTNKENNDIIKQIVLDQKSGLASNNDSYFITILSYRIALSIDKINNLPFQPEITAEVFPDNLEKGLTYVKERAKVIDAWPVFKLSAIQEAFRVFEEKILELTNEVQNPSFWKPGAQF